MSDTKRININDVVDNEDHRDRSYLINLDTGEVLFSPHIDDSRRTIPIRYDLYVNELMKRGISLDTDVIIVEGPHTPYHYSRNIAPDKLPRDFKDKTLVMRGMDACNRLMAIDQNMRWIQCDGYPAIPANNIGVAVSQAAEMYWGSQTVEQMSGCPFPIHLPTTKYVLPQAEVDTNLTWDLSNYLANRSMFEAVFARPLSTEPFTESFQISGKTFTQDHTKESLLQQAWQQKLILSDIAQVDDFVVNSMRGPWEQVVSASQRAIRNINKCGESRGL